MASPTFNPVIQRLFLLAFHFLQSIHPATTSCYTSIISFGDSLADTGNFLYSSSNSPGAIARLPYGETYFHRPTGRFSDGRLIIDFVAQDIGIPLVPPYLEGPGDHGFRQGVNFAVAGATALENDFFREKGLDIIWTEYSLGTQIEWFKQLLPSLCSSSSDCKGILSSSLFLMGEIGGNDYNHPFFQGRTVDEIRTFVPSIISAISSAINALIQLGAKTLVVPGNFPIGCVSWYLQTFQSKRKEDYDSQTGCIKRLNEFAEYHNRLLVDELDHLRQLHPHVTIIYADYYKALLNIFRSPTEFASVVIIPLEVGKDSSMTTNVLTGAAHLPALAFHSTVHPVMAASTFHLLLQLSSLLALLSLRNVHTATTSCYTSIFSFGDSLADTGNFLYSSSDTPRGIVRLPYGETYFHRLTGRYSDGRLIIDFIAQDIGIPLVPPYLAGPGAHGFRQVANFAVGGATALSNDFFREEGLDVSWTEYSLGTQSEWFKQLLPSLCSSSSVILCSLDELDR